MNKEDLINSFSEHHVFNKDDILRRLTKFFSQNVCIPKGDNRHPYADVLHEWIEGAEIIRKHSNNIYDMGNCDECFNADYYHIKPSEPVYEYMWYTDVGETLWMTDDEAESKDEYWNRANETKRVRQ